jgi:probable rRNA maturation factor
MDHQPIVDKASAPRAVVSNRQHLEVDEPDLAALAERVLAGEGVTGEVSLSFVTTDEMANLHLRYMGEPGPTDVLAFPMGEDGLLGDLVICPAEAGLSGTDLASELRLLVAHGILHLLGHDHEEESARRKMWVRQERYSGLRVEDEP